MTAGTSDLDEAERFLAQAIADVRERVLNPRRRKRTWEEAVMRYLNESTKATLANEAIQFKFPHRYLTKKPLEDINKRFHHSSSIRQEPSSAARGVEPDRPVGCRAATRQAS
ncbi:MAG: hypothetical protein HY579_02310 [Nitrospinae bacterium]|nr:hypothetical protein [Nitrospinota bacterium]